MKASRKDHVKRKINQGKGVLDETVDEKILETDSEEVEGIFEDPNEEVSKMFKHLGKAVEIKF
ncbi:MAG: hypothetical protein V2B20_03030 [Pseudomonadota bacterium]